MSAGCRDNSRIGWRQRGPSPSGDDCSGPEEQVQACRSDGPRRCCCCLRQLTLRRTEDAEDRLVCPSPVASVTKNPRDALELPTRRPAPSPTSAGLKAYSSGSGRKYGSGEFFEPRGHLTNDLEPLTRHTRPGWRRPRRNRLNPPDHPGPVAPSYASPQQPEPEFLQTSGATTRRETPADRPRPGWERSVLSPGRLSLSQPERTLHANQAAHGVKRPRRSGGL